jgi:hypothetical protein
MPTPPRASALSGDSGGLIAKSDPPLYLTKLPCGAHQIALDPLSAMRLRGWDLWRGCLPGLDFLNPALDELSSSIQCALEFRNLTLGPIDPAIQILLHSFCCIPDDIVDGVPHTCDRIDNSMSSLAGKGEIDEKRSRPLD